MKLIVAAAFLAVSFHVRAADWILAADTVEVRPGATVTLEVLYAGAGQEKFPDKLTVRANAGSRTWRLDLVAAGPAQGARRRYTVELPPDAHGFVVLDLSGHPSSKLVLLARGGVDAVARLVTPPPRSAPATAAETPDPQSQDQYQEREKEAILSTNEPMYFLVGNRQGTSARYQLSFKYRFFDDDSGWGKTNPWLTGLYFGYTQNSFWDLSARSKPFRDTSYRPSLYFQWLRPDDKAWVDAARVGFEHESNGKDGVSSRSLNTVFVQPVWRWKLDDDRVLTFDPKFQSYINKDENPDIQKFRGYADWRLRFGREDGFIVASTVRVGTGGKGSVQADASYPLRRELVGGIGGYWHVQYFNGYGEDLLGYNQKRDAQLRVGFSIVR
jgi:outer membrane phospholipase A